MARPTRAERISRHEAGHAIASRLMRLPDCGEVSIIEPRAHAVFSCNCGAASIVALLAGSVAENLAFNDYDAHGGSEDWKNAWERMQRLGYDDGGAALWSYTFDLLSPYCGLVKFLAIKLERELVLDGPAVDRLVGFTG
jgi:hypothetical protein